MKTLFTKQQIAYIKSLGLNFDFNNLTDDNYVAIEETVAGRLTYLTNCEENYELNFDENYECYLCERILDRLSNIGLEFNNSNSLELYLNKPIKVITTSGYIFHGIVIDFRPSKILSKESIVIASVKHGVITLVRKSIENIKIKNIPGYTILKNVKRRYPIMLKYREILNKTVKIIDMNGNTWCGLVTDYFYPEDNVVLNQDSFALTLPDRTLIEFYEKDIFSMTIIK